MLKKKKEIKTSSNVECTKHTLVHKTYIWTKKGQEKKKEHEVKRNIKYTTNTTISEYFSYYSH